MTVRTKQCGWTGEEYNITIEIGGEKDRPAFNSKQLRRVLLRARQACPRLKPKPDVAMQASIVGKVCEVKLTYSRQTIEKGFRTTASHKIEPLILTALQARLPDL